MFSSLKLNRHWAVMVVGVLLLAGCLSEQENVLEVTKTAEPTSVALVTPTATATATPTTVVIPTHTATSTATNTPTKTKFPPTSTPTPTTTPAPTLSAIEEGEFLSALLSGNAGCELPCWWGVTPGQTSIQAARDLFASQGIDDWTVSFDGTYVIIGLGYPRNDGYHSHHVLVEFRLKRDIVQIVSVDGGNRGEEFRPLFIRDWQLYSPLAMLNRYDLPTYIEFAPVENSPYYRLKLIYASLGVMISYIVPFEHLNDEEVRVCFNLEVVDYIYMTLFTPDAENSTPYPVDDSIFWEVATGLNREAFRQMFSDNSTPPCVEVNR